MSADYYLEGAKSPYEIRFHNVGNLAPGIVYTGYVDVPQPEGIQEDLKGPEKRIRLFTRAKECDWSSSGSGTSPVSAHTTLSLARRRGVQKRKFWGGCSEDWTQNSLRVARI